MSLLELYRANVRARGFREEPAQQAVLGEMERIAAALAARVVGPEKTTESVPGFIERFARIVHKPAPPPAIKGLYCWGEVGRGKTFLMDLLMDYLPTRRKRRSHFHRFMLEIGAALTKLDSIQNPIEEVVRKMGEEIDVLCLDEFRVVDITHAMFLERLLKAMGKTGITLVTTSNSAPEDLYKNGLQRARFLPAIAWIREHLVVHKISGEEDLRRRHFRIENVVRRPDNAENRAALETDLRALTRNCGSAHGDPTALQIGSRRIAVLWQNAGGVLFDFQELCAGRYSQKDYLELAARFPYLGVVGVPALNDRGEDAARRFLLLLDTCYDCRVKLLLTAAVPMDTLYSGTQMADEFARLKSRLFAIQSAEYWDQAHLAR